MTTSKDKELREEIRQELLKELFEGENESRIRFNQVSQYYRAKSPWFKIRSTALLMGLWALGAYLVLLVYRGYTCGGGGA